MYDIYQQTKDEEGSLGSQGNEEQIYCKYSGKVPKSSSAILEHRALIFQTSGSESGQNHQASWVACFLKADLFHYASHPLQPPLQLIYTLPNCPHLSQTCLSLSVTLFFLFQSSVTLSLPPFHPTPACFRALD